MTVTDWIATNIFTSWVLAIGALMLFISYRKTDPGKAICWAILAGGWVLEIQSLRRFAGGMMILVYLIDLPYWQACFMGIARWIRSSAARLSGSRL